MTKRVMGSVRAELLKMKHTFFNSVSCGGAGCHRWFHAVLLPWDNRKSHGADHGVF